MKVKREVAVKLFKELGVEHADKWTDARLKGKLEKMNKVADKDTEADSDDTNKLLKGVLKAIKDGDELVIVSADEAPAKKAKAAPAKASGKKAKAKVEEEDEEDEEEDADEDSDDEDEESEEDEEDADDESEDDDSEDEEDESEDDEEESDEDEEEEDEDDVEDEPVTKKDKAKAKKAKAQMKKAGGDKGPGIIGSIVEFLSAASEDKPLSKQKLADKLQKRFTDRDRDGMLRTINVQVPNRLKIDKKLNVKKNENGYWIASGKPKAEKSDEAPAKKDKAKAKKAKKSEDDDE